MPSFAAQLTKTNSRRILRVLANGRIQIATFFTIDKANPPDHRQTLFDSPQHQHQHQHQLCAKQVLAN
jgi:hypothetical protein